MSQRESLSITYANTLLDVVGMYYPAKRSNHREEPDDPAEFEFESISVGNVDMMNLFECLSVVKGQGFQPVDAQDFLSKIEDLCIEKLESQSEI